MIVFTDLDGTIHSRKKAISTETIKTIELLKRKGITVVLATGRSLYSMQKAGINENLFDYIIFSTGYGIKNIKTKTINTFNSILQNDIEYITDVLNSLKVDFIRMKGKGENYKFSVFQNSAENPQFEERLSLYSECIINEKKTEKDVSQFFAVIPESWEEKLAAIQSKLKRFSIFHSKSPRDNITGWLEVFHPAISKANAAEEICRIENILPEQCMSIGNDFNDLSLLEFTGHSFIVENSPEYLKSLFVNVPHCDENGFSHAARLWISRVLV